MLTVSEIESVNDDGLRATQAAFLEAVIDTGSMTDAAEQLGISRRSPYNWVASEEYHGTSSFTDALALAKKAAGERAAGRVFQHSMTTQGMPGVIASIAFAKRYDSGWNDQLNIRHSGAVLSAHIDLAELDQSERADLLGLMARRLQLTEATATDSKASPISPPVE